MAEQAIEEQIQNNGQPVRDEIATVEKDIFRGYIGKVLINPDEVLSKESSGKGLKLYEDIERDAQVYATVQTRKLAVIGKEWEVIPAGEKRADKKIAEFVEENLRRIAYDQARIELMDAVMKGYAVSEIMWAQRGNDIVISELRGRDPRRFTFDLPNKLRMLTLGNMVEGIEVPQRKFVVHTFQMKYYSPFGKALGEKLYWPVWFKKHAVKFWVMFCEKFGMPTAIGKYPPGTDKPTQDALLTALEKIQQDMAIKIPDNMEISLLEAVRTGTINTYESLCQYMDYQISKIVLGQTLTTEVGDTGSYAASKTHDEVRGDICKADCDALCETLNKQLIIPLVDYNFPNVETYPETWCRCEEEQDLKPLAERDKLLAVDIGVPVTKQYFYDTYGIPHPEEGEELVVPTQPTNPSPPSAPGKGSKELGVRGEEYQERQRKGRHIAQDGEIDGAYEAALAQGKELFEKLNETIIAGVKKKPGAGIEKMIRDAVQESGFENMLVGASVLADMIGRAQIIEEAEDFGFRISDFGFAETRFGRLGPDEAWERFRKKIPMSKAAFDALVDEYKNEAFSIAGEFKDEVIWEVKGELDKALLEGLTQDKVIANITGLFERMGITPLQPHRVENIFRTNMMGAYNAGRWDTMQDKHIAEYFPMFQYDAINDSRTRPSHAAMDGHIARRDDPIWQTWWPPNGYQCRCTVRPVSVSEEVGALKPAPAGQPDPGFAGNPGIPKTRKARK